jgi:hypothetical protein
MIELSVEDYIEMINDFKEHLDMLEARALKFNILEGDELI